jgi:hypothetical protein
VTATANSSITPVFVENPVARARPEQYLDITVSVEKVLKSWRVSLFSFEWLRPDGRIKGADELPEAEQPKRREVERRLAQGEALEKPVLGIGLLDNIEIGSGRAVFLTLAALGAKTVPVHIPRSNESEFKAFRADAAAVK